MQTHTDISLYMTSNDREKRREHLALDEPCIEIGGKSGDFRGLLAHYLLTTIPYGAKKTRVALLYHACNNEKCSNPKHLYWGTDRDNHTDQVELGTHRTLPQRMEAKYGKEYMWKLRSKGGKKGGKISGGHNRLSDDDIQRYKDMMKRADPSKRGWISKLARETGLSHTHIRRIWNRVMTE